MVKKFLWGYEVYENETDNKKQSNAFDTTLFYKRISKLQQDFNKLEQSVKDFNDANDTNTQEIENKLSELERIQTNIFNKLGRFDLSSMKVKLDQLSEIDLRNKLNELTREIEHFKLTRTNNPNVLLTTAPTTPQKINQINEKIESIQQEINNIEDDELKNMFDQFKIDFDNLKIDVANLQSILNDLNSGLGLVIKLKIENTLLREAVTKFEQSIESLETDMESLKSKPETDLTFINTKLNDLESNLNTLQSNPETDLTFINTKLNDLESNLNTLQSKPESDLTFINTKLTDLESNLNTL